jgi:hypothetical protein
MSANRVLSCCGWGIVVVAVGCLCVPARAIDPFGARYLEDTDEMFWFLQISDSHVGEDWLYGSQDTDNLDYVVGETVDAVLPEFVVLTGDIVDATNGLWIPIMQYQSEWDEYRSVIDAWGMDVTFFHDVSGNHDTYTDAGATHYVGNSLTGQFTGTWHDSWVHAFPFGDYLFVCLNTADTDGSTPGLDSEGLEQGELDFFEDALTSWSSAHLAFVFTHHPRWSFDYGESEMLDLLADHQVSLWGNGHSHDYDLEWRDATLHFNLDSLGRSESNNLGVFAVDHDGVAARGVDIGTWPIVLATAPTDTSLGGTNPYSYPVSAYQMANPVRALVFDPGTVVSVAFEVDGAADYPMVEVAPDVWQGEWDCSAETTGLHEITVWATSTSGTQSHTIEVEVAITECDDGLDNDGNGYTDHPDDAGCWGPSDNSESGWTPGDDDDDSAGDDDDSAGDDDDDDSAGDDDDSAADDDDDTVADDDDDTVADDDDDTGETDDDDDSAPTADDDDTSPVNENPSRVGGGCGCSSTPATNGRWGMLMGVSLWWLLRRRTGRR